jgi:hypothetical protein
MPLEVRREPDIVPQYSLTGDLLSFMRCGLQYRYHNGSSLPPSRPVQLWFGEFIHGIMEAAFRTWRNQAPPPQFPWPTTITAYRQNPPAGRLAHDIGELGDRVEQTLRSQGKSPRSAAVRESAYARATRAVNEIGPHLFPLVASAEERIIGTRPLTRPAGNAGPRRTDYYELHGIVDVLTRVTLDAAQTGNVLRDALLHHCQIPAGDYEVIVDYKGSRRPRTNEAYWNQGAWQVQTYGWLRGRQHNAVPVAAGILLYVNELAPGTAELENLKAAIANGTTDVSPTPNSRDDYLLRTWRPGNAAPDFSPAFRIARAVRVVPVDGQSTAAATQQFDNVVLTIEGRVASEARTGVINGNWDSTGDEETCAACDFRHFCPSPAPRQQGAPPRPVPCPTAP